MNRLTNHGAKKKGGAIRYGCPYCHTIWHEDSWNYCPKCGYKLAYESEVE